MHDIFVQARDALCNFWQGRKVGLLQPRFDRGSQQLINELVACGASVDVIVTCSIGDLPIPSTTRLFCLQEEGLAGNNWAFYQWLHSPSRSFGQWLERVDPSSTLTFIGDSWTDIPYLCDRVVHGWRRPMWATLEDKTKIDAFWHDIGIPVPRFEVSACQGEIVEPIVSRLDQGFGSVIAIDSTQGFSSGAEGLAWVHTATQLSKVFEHFTSRTKHLRVAEFIPGVPCSILAMVMTDGVAVFEPTEIITLVEPSSNRLLYCGWSNHWRPDIGTRALLRRTARRIGESLASTLSYRGIFSVDGILSDSIFYATELNPRHAAGLGLRSTQQDFPIYLFNRGVQESIPQMDKLESSQIEQVFCNQIRSIPSHSILVPARATGESFDRSEILMTTIESNDVKQVITYSREKTLATILKVEPMSENGLMSEASSALARHLTNRSLQCFIDKTQAKLTMQQINVLSI